MILSRCKWDLQRKHAVSTRLIHWQSQMNLENRARFDSTFESIVWGGIQYMKIDQVLFLPPVQNVVLVCKKH